MDQVSEELRKIQDRGIELNRKAREKAQPSAEDLIKEIKGKNNPNKSREVKK